MLNYDPMLKYATRNKLIKEKCIDIQIYHHNQLFHVTFIFNKQYKN